MHVVDNNWPSIFLSSSPVMSNDLQDSQGTIAVQGMFPSRYIYSGRASPMTLLCYLGIVFLAILCKPRHILLLLSIWGMCG